MDSRKQYSTPMIIRKPSEGHDAMKFVEAHLSAVAVRLQNEIDICLSELRCCFEAGDTQSVRDLKKHLRRLRCERSWYISTKTNRAHPETE